MHFDFLTDENGTVPFVPLSIILLLIAGMTLYHFYKLDQTMAEEKNHRTSAVNTFYTTAQVALDLQSAVRSATEAIILNESIETYDDPIDVDQWRSKENYRSWRDSLQEEMEGAIRRQIFRFYAEGGVKRISSWYETHNTDFDFSEFMGEKFGGENFEVKLTPDKSDGLRTQKLQVDLVFGNGSGIIKSSNRFTDSSLSMKVGSSTSVDARPFTISDKVYDFSGIFKRNAKDVWDFSSNRDTVDELAWYVWAAEEILGLFEANLKHNVRFATDERATYSLVHLIIAYKELQHFGSFDYLSTLREVLRPWMGDEDLGKDFLRSLKLGIESGYADQALGAVKSGVLLEEIAKLSRRINYAIITAAAQLDASLISQSNFLSDYIPPTDKLPKLGVIQRLNLASDLSNVERASGDIDNLRNAVAESEESPDRFNDGWIKNLKDDEDSIKKDYDEFVLEPKRALTASKAASDLIANAKADISQLGKTLEGGRCESPLVSQLWFGGVNDPNGGYGLKGLREILPHEEAKAQGILTDLSDLAPMLEELKYDDGDGTMDETHGAAQTELRGTRASLSNAREYKNYYFSCRDTWGITHSKPTSGCEESREMSETYDCGTKKTPKTCTRRWKEYRCTCKDYYSEKYSYHMANAKEKLYDSSKEIAALHSSLSKWFDDHGLTDALSATNAISGFADGTSIANFYYNHHGSELPGEGYAREFLQSLNLSNDVGVDSATPALSYPIGDEMREDFVDYGYVYVHTTISSLYAALNPEDYPMKYAKAKEALEIMKKEGFFDSLADILEKLMALLNYLGEIDGALSDMNKKPLEFPNLMDHLYTTLLLPPLQMNGEGYSIIHDIRLRVDNKPISLKLNLPIMGKTEFELPPAGSIGKGISLPIPFTPVHIYGWGFEIVRSQVGEGETKTSAIPEKSTIRVIDFANQGNVAPLLEISAGNKSLPAPVYAHKPVMLKYEFTAADYQDESNNHAIAKKLESRRLPPVIILSLGPFITNFGGWEEPPDATPNTPRVRVNFSREWALINYPPLVAEINHFSDDDVSILARIHENANGNVHQIRPQRGNFIQRSLKKGKGLSYSIDIADLELAKIYGWSVLNADAYAYDAKSMHNASRNAPRGEDHASIPIIDPELELDVRIASVEAEKIVVSNLGNRRVDVILKSSHDSTSCSFFKDDNGWIANIWEGTLEAGESASIDAATSGRVGITFEALIPEDILEHLTRMKSVHANDSWMPS